MKKGILLILAILILFISISTANAELVTSVGDSNSNAYYLKSNNPLSDSHEFKNDFVISKSKSINKHEVIISGKIVNCNDSEPFEGAKIFVKSLKGKTLATTISNSNGKYKVSFKSDDISFIVQATYPGHVNPSKKITVSGSKKVKYGRANFELGELDVRICSGDIAVYDSKITDNFPDTHLIHLNITNNGSETAYNVSVNFAGFSNNYSGTYHLVSGENSSKFIGNMSPGESICVFFLINTPHPPNNGEHFLTNYNITVNGSNIAQINKTGPIGTFRTQGQDNSEKIINFSASTKVTFVGDIITFNITDHGPHGEEWFTPFVSFDPTVFRLISVVTTNGTNYTTDSVIYTGMLTEGHNTNYTTTWTFEVIGLSSDSEVFAAVDGGNSHGVQHFKIGVGSPIHMQVLPKVNLTINKTVSDPYPNFGDTITYTINVTNNAQDDATGISVIDPLPDGLIFVSAPYASYNSTTRMITWTIGNLPAGQTVSLNITVIVNIAGFINNTANVTGGYNENNNSSTVTIYVPSVDLAITKTVDNPYPDFGDNVIFNITVTNRGPDNANGVFVVDKLPDGLVFVSSSDLPSYNPGTGNWYIGNLNAGDTITLTILATVNRTGTITNFANVTGEIYDTNLTNNYANATISTLTADLAINKTVSNSTPNFRDNINYTIIVTNKGPNDASGVFVVDILPDGLIFVSASPNIGSYNHTTGIWNIGNLMVNQEVTLTITVTVNKTGTITNFANVTGNEKDENLTNNEANMPINVPSATDLAINKVVSNSTPTLGDNITYTLIVTNNGPDNATKVNVTDILPDGLLFVSASSATYDPVTRVITWNIGDLDAGESVTLTIVVTVTKTGNITNFVNVIGAEYDIDLSNNDANVTIRAVEPRIVGVTDADLAITKTVNNSSPYLGDTITYTITVTNNGPDNATGVKVVDILPDGLLFVSASQGTYDPTTGIWNIGILNNGASIILNIIVIVNKIGKITNKATVTGNENDTNNQNDNSSVTIEIKDPVITKIFTDTKDPVDKPVNDTNKTIDDKPANDTKIDINATKTDIKHILMQKTALPPVMLILVILSIFGLILPRFKR
ncbi:MAG: DUF11 domain-containing protein [Methanobacteriaceae archaeon]|nr:DUF11 domain-containing protein [Candidatus Methanorudis spinitermitis]